jgi:flavin reductase (DIM6/NTAB) family NADH-FMN oxidoreductase RutF
MPKGSEVELLKVECDLDDVVDMTVDHLWGGGLLLTSVSQAGTYNAMTIGWGLVGRFWRAPVFMVAVRPTRHTHRLIEETQEFVVNVPDESMKDIVEYCGKVSGRDYDKIAEKGLTAEQGHHVRAPIIRECTAHYECRVIGTSKVIPELVSGEVQKMYASGNHHTLYYGKILSIRKEQ